MRQLRNRSVAPNLNPAQRRGPRAAPLAPEAVFEDAMQSLDWQFCDVCHTRSLEFKPKESCAVHGKRCEKFSDRNKMDPGPRPPELEGLTFLEQQLIARVHPVVCVYKIRGHQYGYSGNVISFPQDVQEVASALPHRVQDLDSIIVVRKHDSAGHVDFRVRSGRVRAALVWLRDHNHYYEGIQINEDNLAELPEDGNVFDAVPGYMDAEEEVRDSGCGSSDEEDDPGDQHEEHEAPAPRPGNDQDVSAWEPPENIEQDAEAPDPQDEEHADGEAAPGIVFSGVPLLQPPDQEEQVNAALNWPTIGRHPIREFEYPGYISMAFPALFPTGDADYNQPRNDPLTARDYFRHLLYYRDGRFANDPRFRFFAFNTVMRWQAMRSGSMFVRRNKELEGKTVAELRQMVAARGGLAREIMFYGNKLRGTRQYWGARRSELLDLIDQVGLPTFFMTLSAADLHWPDLFRLLLTQHDFERDPDEDPRAFRGRIQEAIEALTEEDRRNMTAEEPFVPSMFFCRRVEFFLDKILMRIFNVKQRWWRYEWQFRGKATISWCRYI